MSSGALCIHFDKLITPTLRTYMLLACIVNAESNTYGCLLVYDGVSCLFFAPVQSTKRGMKIRYETFGSVQEMITLRAGVYFKSNLQERGYVGELLFDHEKETLELKVSTATVGHVTECQLLPL